MTKVGEHITLDIIGTTKEYDPSVFEKVINKNPTPEEYNNSGVMRNIEYYKDRLAKDLYECKRNQIEKEAEDKKLEQLKF